MSATFEICSTEEDMTAANSLQWQTLTAAGLNPASPELVKERFRQRELLIGKMGSVVVGYLIFYTREDAVISISIGTHPDYQRQGIATGLSDLALSEFRKRGMRSIKTYSLASLDSVNALNGKRDHMLVGQEQIQGKLFNVYIKEL